MPEVPLQYRNKFHESANRPHLRAGCEPTLLALAFLGCLLIGYSVPNRYGISAAVLLFFFLRWVLQEMAKEDPRMFRMYYEAQRYNQGFWCSKSNRAHRWRS